MALTEWTPHTIGDLLDRAVAARPEGTAFVGDERRLSYRELGAATDRMARAFLRLGVEKGEKVALLLPNSVEWVVGFLAAAKIGAITLGINTRYRARELEYVLQHSDSSVLIGLPQVATTSFASMLSELCPELKSPVADRLRSERFPCLRHVIMTGPCPLPGTLSLEELLARDEPGMADRVHQAQAVVSPGDVALLQYTSGTTSFPKGAMLTHDGVVRNATMYGRRMGLDESDVCFSSSVFCHVGGSISSILKCLAARCCLVTTGHFEPGSALALIAREHCTCISGIDTVYRRLLGHPDRSTYDLSALRKGIAHGAPDSIKAVYEELGVRDVLNLYGLSECSCNVATSLLSDPIEVRMATMGKPHAGLELKIVDPETRQALAAEERGEICVRGWGVMKGYYKQPEETAKAIDDEGWLHTGDYGFLDANGYLVYLGRIKDVIRVGGENVAALEVETVLSAHPAVAFAQAVAAPDEDLGEVVVAFVELRPGCEASTEELIDHCRGQLARFKVPRDVQFVTEWPMSASHKIQKNVLRQSLI